LSSPAGQTPNFDAIIAELEPHGSLRVRPAESFGITFDMESQFRPAGGEWGEMTKAFRGS